MSETRPDQRASRKPSSPDTEKAQLDQMTELANIGAGHAADAFAQIAGRPMWIGVPAVRVDQPFISPGACTDQRASGVFFQLEGCIDALIGILFSETTTEILARKLLGIEEGELESELTESVLMEVGNILASHIASAIADTLGERLLPSVPTLVLSDVEGAFLEYVTESMGSEVIRIESELFDLDHAICGRLIFVPAPF